MQTVGTEVAGEILNYPATGKYRGYLLTINNYTEQDVNSIKQDDCQYYCYQFERGEKGTPHIQAFIYYTNPRVWPKKKYPRAHIEPVRSVIAAMRYCKKEDTRIEGPWEAGDPPSQGKRNDLSAIADAIREGATPADLALDYPESFIKYHKGIQALINAKYKLRTEKPYNLWLWGGAGAGKTRRAFELSTDVYIKDGTKWWDGYTQQEVIIIDDFDGKWPFRDLLRLLDRYPYQGESKGNYVHINSAIIVITCEFPPSEFWQDNALEQVMRRIDKVEQVIAEVTNEKQDRPLPILKHGPNIS